MLSEELWIHSADFAQSNIGWISRAKPTRSFFCFRISRRTREGGRSQSRASWTFISIPEQSTEKRPNPPTWTHFPSSPFTEFQVRAIVFRGKWEGIIFTPSRIRSRATLKSPNTPEVFFSKTFNRIHKNNKTNCTHCDGNGGAIQTFENKSVGPWPLKKRR